MMRTGPLFKANLEATEDIIINQGGTDAGKSVAIVQVLIYFATKPPPKIDPVITIVSKSIPDSKKGVLRIFRSIMYSNKALSGYIKDWNETERTITFTTGWIIEFTSYVDEQTARQGKRQYLFVNEANGISYPIFWQLAKRTRIRTFIDYNPSYSFWPHEKLIGTKKDENDLHATVKLLISDHRHNPFLSEEDHAKTENIKDPDLWRVYARGLTGNLTGIIFTDWTQITPDKFPEDMEKQFFGLDFGFSNDPTALVKCVQRGNSIFVKELAYKSGSIPAKHIAEILRANGYNEEQPVYCDHAPELIRELRMIDVLAIPARKGPGSINAGIEKLKEYSIFFVGDNIEFERQRYMWLIDKDTGKPTNSPIDQFNHVIDSIRMAVMSHFWRKE